MPASEGYTWAAPGLWAMLTVHAGALLALHPAAAPTASDLWLMGGAFCARNLCVSAGYHRYFAHRAFKVHRLTQFLLAFVGGMAVMRSALWWASKHRQHHGDADGPDDPHSPRRGLAWAHMGWFLDRRHQATRLDLIPDFARYPELRFLDRHEWLPIAVFVGACAAIGGFSGWVWAANVGTVLLCHATFALNSVTHRWGRRRYATHDDSTNLWWVAWLSFGEGWHNNHHRWPNRARLGERWWELDVSWCALAVGRRLGLVWGIGASSRKRGRSE